MKNTVVVAALMALLLSGLAVYGAAYGASKFAVEGLSLAVAQEVERFGIKVTVVEPGFFRTGLLNPSSVEWSSEHIEDVDHHLRVGAAAPRRHMERMIGAVEQLERGPRAKRFAERARETRDCMEA